MSLWLMQRPTYPITSMTVDIIRNCVIKACFRHTAADYERLKRVSERTQQRLDTEQCTDYEKPSSETEHLEQVNACEAGKDDDEYHSGWEAGYISILHGY
jgi:hypothetical protein